MDLRYLLFFNIPFPSAFLKGLEFGFRRIAAWFPERTAVKFVGKELLLHEISRIVVGIKVVFAVIKLFHEFCGRIAQMEWNWKIAGLLHFPESVVDGHIS